MSIYEDKNFKDYVNELPAATENDLAAGNNMPLVRSDDVKKMGGENVASRNDANIRCFVVVDNPEYVYAVVDNDAKFLFGVKNDGSFEFSKGIPKTLQDFFVKQVQGKDLIDSIVAASASSTDDREFLRVICDSQGRVVEAIQSNTGKHIFYVAPKFVNGLGLDEGNVAEIADALKDYGFSSGQGDWSGSASLEIGKPRCAIVNFTGINAMPTTKTADLHGAIQFWDLSGNYFKKNVVMNAQGTSSLNFVKKNIAIDICNDEWLGDDTFKIKFGDWVAQDSFHLKAYYTDYFRGVAAVGYDIYKAFTRDRGVFKDAAWKMALLDRENQRSYVGLGYGEPSDSLRTDSGALCFPQGFPCIVYLNGGFYGIFSWQLKKHRDNYHMDKSVAENVHLDGELSVANFWGGNINWEAFEIRNPKSLYCADGTAYDGENPKEIASTSVVNAWIAAGTLPDGTAVTSKIQKNLVMTGKVKAYIESLAAATSSIDALSTDAEKKLAFESIFNVENLIDYLIFSDLTYNSDGFAKNWQWTTWDGVHWFCCPYDLDMMFGAVFSGNYIRKQMTTHLGTASRSPTGILQRLYLDKVKADYAHYRNLGLLDPKDFVSRVNEWYKAIGEQNFKKEWSKWSESPCNNDIVVNSQYWELVLGDDGLPVDGGETITYDGSATYNVGDTCTANVKSDARWTYTFKCVASCNGISPVITYNFKDSIYRIDKWVSENFAIMDDLYGYNQQ